MYVCTTKLVFVCNYVCVYVCMYFLYAFMFVFIYVCGVMCLHVHIMVSRRMSEMLRNVKERNSRLLDQERTRLQQIRDHEVRLSVCKCIL